MSLKINILILINLLLLSGCGQLNSESLKLASVAIPSATDPYPQYILKNGTAGGNTLNGGIASGENLTLESTAGGTKGFVLLSPTGGNVGIGLPTPLDKLHVAGGAIRSTLNGYGTSFVAERDSVGTNLTITHDATGFTKIFNSVGPGATNGISILRDDGVTNLMTLTNGGDVLVSGDLSLSGSLSVAGDFFYGNSSTRTETLNDAGQLGGASGFFETGGPTPAANWYPGASGWQHLLSVRHSNVTNNYAMQFAGSFFNQELYFRKTANLATQDWSKVVLANATTGVIPQPAWTPLSFTIIPIFPDWADYGGGYGPAAYYKSTDGRVYLRGLVSGGPCGLGWSIAVLPASFRPAGRRLFTSISNDALVRIDVLADGSIVPLAGCDTAWVSLDNISFRVDGD